MPILISCQDQAELPDSPLDVNYRGDFTIAAPGFGTLAEYMRLEPVQTEKDVQSLVKWSLLETAETIVHIINASRTKNWKFLEPLTTESERIESDFAWMNPRLTKFAPWGSSKLPVHVKAPWHFEVDEGDCTGLWELITLKSFPQVIDSSRGLTRAQRAWAQIFEDCLTQRTPWFIFCTYDGFVFGVFSKHLSTAYVTEPVPFDSTDPTVLQCVVFWIQSAMKAEGGWSIPITPDEPRIPKARRIPPKRVDEWSIP